MTIIKFTEKNVFYVLFCLLFVWLPKISSAQSDKAILKDIRQSVYFLADDRLEGRRTGSAGEEIAYQYIQKKFKKNGLVSFTQTPHYLQPFEVNEGVELGNNNLLKAGGESFLLHKDYFPLPYSTNGKIVSNDKIFFYDLSELLIENANNPHFDLNESLYQKTATLIEKNAGKSIFLFNSSDKNDSLLFDEKNKKKQLKALVVYCSKTTIEKIKQNKNSSAIVKITPKIKTGHNVIGYIDNHAENTVVIGAHYDHLGYGQDHNSLYTGSTPMIHNGADDNASGTAAMMALSKLLKKSKSTFYNYLFIAFSGEELGLYGSKYFTEHSTVDLKKVTFMINMDMVGRLNDSTHAITLGGYGTSPAWGEIIPINDTAVFKIKIDSAGSGPSDHTSFYRKDIPVLFFFTGIHSDYHKPSDDADKINFKGEVEIIKYIVTIIDKTTAKGKLVFTKTREAAAMGKSSFKVTLGIMADYTFSGNGVFVDGVSDARPAQKAGIRHGDIIYKLGDYIVEDMQSYMQALNKYNKGDEVIVKIKRGNDLLDFKIVF